MDKLTKGFPIRYEGLKYKVAEVGQHKNITFYSFISECNKITLMSHGAFEEHLKNKTVTLTLA